MKILYAGSEVLPFSSSGGLADVMGSLPAALKKRHPDDDVAVISPLYSSIRTEYREKMTRVCEFSVRLSWRNQYCGIYSYILNGVTYYFVDNEYYFRRSSLYGDFDDGERFAYFSASVLAFMSQINYYPDILHCNDWQTALAVIYLKTRYCNSEFYRDIKAVFSIHNILFQGQYDHAIAGDVFDLEPSWASIVDHDGCINLMKGAVVCADQVVTVSERYAEEIKTPEYGHGLDPAIRMYSCKLSGILNGIDYEYYDPKTDNALTRNYTYRSTGRKGENKRALQKQLALPESEDIPMISLISRLTDQKGIDLVASKVDELLLDDVQFIVLGCGDWHYENFFRDLEARHRDKVRSMIMYDKTLSKKIYASSDLFLMPSRFEPCGLSQMIASRYGAVPIVRETGGLYDSIKPYRFVDGKQVGNGFTFAACNGNDMLFVIRQALGLYRDKEAFKALTVKVMKHDFSWNTSAEKYYQLYNAILPERP
ncbi:MAG: glycogen synthase GlgA [Clostridia bacterium]|nr:glycogen synthase GlgA [Clostridia bacterium]